MTHERGMRTWRGTKFAKQNKQKKTDHRTALSIPMLGRLIQTCTSDFGRRVRVTTERLFLSSQHCRGRHTNITHKNSSNTHSGYKTNTSTGGFDDCRGNALALGGTSPSGDKNTTPTQHPRYDMPRKRLPSARTGEHKLHQETPSDIQSNTNQLLLKTLRKTHAARPTSKHNHEALTCDPDLAPPCLAERKH